jgi:hypothetical protein
MIEQTDKNKQQRNCRNDVLEQVGQLTFGVTDDKIQLQQQPQIV